VALNLSEITRSLVLTKIKTDIAAKLSAIRTDRADAKVSTEPFRTYLTYFPAQTLLAPALFVIVDDIDFRKRQKNANGVTAVVNMTLAVVVEERDRELLTIKAERYQTALHEILDDAHLVSSDSQVKCVPMVMRAGFTETYSPGSQDPQGVFRKDVYLDLEVEHYER
jgi:hypothetical protein